jgi:pentatricopeptide repeat protein
MTLSFLSPGSLLTSASGSKAVIHDNPSLLLLIENIAILAARCDSLNSLNALMRYYIQQKDPQAILILYNKFMSLVGDEDMVTGSGSGGETAGEVLENEEGMDLLATDVERSWVEFSVAAGQMHLVLAAITAHAMTDSFKGALGVYLSTTVELEASTALAYLKAALRDQHTLFNLVKQYISKLQVAKLISKPLLFSHKVSDLGVKRAGSKLESLYSNIISGLSGSAYLAIDPSSTTSARTVAMTPFTWNALLGALLRCERKDLAGRLWDDMTRLGHPPGVSMWTTLLDSHARLGAFQDALETWSMMLQQGVKPDTLAYRSIISALFKGRRPNRAMEFFREYQRLPADNSDPHHLSLYNTVLHGLCGSDRATEAEELCATMDRQGPKPDMVSYNTFISYYGRRGKFQGIAATLRTMKAAGSEGDVFTYTTVLSALLKTGKADAADLVLALMDKQGIKRNVALYTTLIDHQLREDAKANLEAAMRMLKWMEESRDNQPNEITYTCVLSGLYRSSWLSVEELQALEKDIIRRLKSRGISFGVPAYHLLIKACLVYPQENGVQQALAYFEEMKRRGLPVINTTWYILLAGLLHRGEWDIAEGLVEEMYASGTHPSASLLQLVYKIREGNGGAR